MRRSLLITLAINHLIHLGMLPLDVGLDIVWPVVEGLGARRALVVSTLVVALEVFVHGVLQCLGRPLA